FVILTTPETPGTVGMFNTKLFSRMKRGAYFINIARGRCVVTADLVEALRSGHLAGAGLDVADPEPLPPDHPLWSMSNVLITPHVGSARRIARSGKRSSSRTVAVLPPDNRCSILSTRNNGSDVATK